MPARGINLTVSLFPATPFASDHFEIANATGLPALHVTTASAGTEPSIVPVQRVVVGDLVAQLPAKVLRTGILLATTDHFSVSDLPVKVPEIFVLRPSDGNEPEYLVGISPTASATAAPRNPTAVTAVARNITIPPNGQSETPAGG